MISGLSVPFVIRQCGNAHDYTLVGECHMHDVMGGKALHSEGFQETWIHLV